MFLLAGVHAAMPAGEITLKERLQGYREHRILAKPRAELHQRCEHEESRERLRVRRTFPRLGHVRVLELEPSDSADRAISRLRATGRYEYVERDHRVRPFATPNDALFQQQWSFNNTGQGGGVAGTDIRALTGWDTLNDASNVVVAVIDSGVRLTHEDLAANLWSDAQGRHGIDATISNAPNYAYNAVDSTGHGTHVAGIIGAVGNNGIGTAGVAWRVKLMPLKFIDEDNGWSSDELECIDYAIANGAHVINASFGGGNHSTSIYEALKRARDAGIVVVAAAGNETSDSDTAPVYPAGYLLDNIVTVASISRSGALALSSNYGSGSVDLAAPGDAIHSTFNSDNASYQTLGGTSMAAPHVAGAIALLKAKFPSDTYRQTINRLLRSTTRVSALSGKVQTGGRLNLAQALTSTDNRPFNDDFSERAVLGGRDVRVRASNSGATVQTAEPAHAEVGNSNSLWWTWTPSESTRVSFDTAGSDYDTLLAVYTGASLGALHQESSNDNASTALTSSRLELNVVAGVTYQIAVASKGAGTGLTVLNIGSVPMNDALASAQTISGVGVKVTGRNRNASLESGEAKVIGGAGRTVWYRWVAPANGRYHAAAFATEIDTVLGVYTGSGVAGLSLVASNNNSASENTDALVSFVATAGSVYHLQVDNSTGDSAGGEFTLTLSDSAWEFATYDEITSSPAVGPDGTIFFGAGSDDAHDRAVYAVNPNGTRRWRFSIGAQGVIGATPAVASDGTVYIGGMDSTLYALDGNTGTKKWSFTAGSPIYAAPAIAADGTVYFHDETTLYALTPNGTQKWSLALNTATEAGTYCSPVIAADGTIYVGTNAGVFRAITDGGSSATIKWTYTADDDIYTTPAIGADGTIYFGTLAGSFYALTPRASSATKKWSITLPAFQGASASITSSPALGGDGTIYFAGYDHKLYALNPQNGSTKWTYVLGDEVRASSPAVAADGTIYIGVYDGLVYAVRADGTLSRTFPTAGWIRSSPAISGTRLYFGSNDAKLRAFDIGHGAAASAWPMFQHDASRAGRVLAPGATITLQPQSQVAAAGSTISLSVGASATGPLNYQWLRNGTAIAGATASTLSLANVQPAHAGVYTVKVTSGNTVTSEPAIVGVSSSVKIVGAGREVLSNRTLPALNNNTYDQILLEGTAVTVTADPGQITRTSFVDLDDDIVQVEFSGAGSLTLVLENAAPAAAAPINYNQPDVLYRKGHAHVIITGADASTNLSIFTVGTITALNPSLFKPQVNYDGIADIGSVAVLSGNGALGAIRTANSHYFGAAGATGVVAPGVRVVGPVYIGDVTAGDDATPSLLFGNVAEAQINGGSLLQLNNQPVKVGGVTRLRFVAGKTSHNVDLPAQTNRARLEEGGRDVTAQIVVNPAP